MRSSIYFDEDMLFRENEALLYGALKRAGISKKNVDFDDYLQEAWIEFLRLIRLEQVSNDPQNFDVFKGRSFRKIVWLLRDLQRRDLNQRSKCCQFDPGLGEILIDEKAVNQEEFLLSNLKMEDFFATLGKLDKVLLLASFSGNPPLAVLEKQYGMSKNSIYKRRKQLKKKWLSFY